MIELLLQNKNPKVNSFGQYPYGSANLCDNLTSHWNPRQYHRYSLEKVVFLMTTSDSGHYP